MPLAAQLIEWLTNRAVPGVVAFARPWVAMLVPALKSFGEWLQTAARRVREMVGCLNAHQDVLKAAAIGMTAMGVALLAMMVRGLVASAAAAWALAVPLLPLYALILGIGVLVGLVAYAWIHNFGDIQGKTEAVWNFIK